VKRFWKDVEVVGSDAGWGVRLDRKTLRTPARAELAVPTPGLAEVIADEWRSAADQVDPGALRMTGLANAAIDRIAPERSAFAAGLARYAEADLACYRSEWPPELVERQAASWDPLLAWARRRFDVDFSTTTSLMHVPQPVATIERLAQAVAALNAYQLAGLSPLVTVGGSLVAALAVFEGVVSPEDGWLAVSVDDRWQLEQWGSDPDAELAFANHHADLLAGARFLELLGEA
jgi:chaperone required for assembly of F1-ATPase